MSLPLETGVLRLTAVLVTGAFSLIAAGTIGLGGSLLLVAALAALAGGAKLAVPALADSPVAQYDSPGVLADLWVGPAVAAALVLPFLGATTGEVKALGGGLGIVGMVNYFLRPVYHLLYSLASRLSSAAR